MKLWLDIEASSLNHGSYPIEIAWIDEEGRSESYLIRPAPGWTDWSPQSQNIHGISRKQLERDGRSVDEVAARAHEALADHHVYSDAHAWDQTWLDRLFLAAGRHGQTPQLLDRVAAEMDVLRVLTKLVTGEQGSREFTGSAFRVRKMAREILVRANEREERARRPHRALPDAEIVRDCWAWIKQEAEETVARELARNTATGGGRGRTGRKAG